MALDRTHFTAKLIYCLCRFSDMSGSKKADLSEMNILAMVLIVAAILVVVLVMKGILTRS